MLINRLFRQKKGSVFLLAIWTVMMLAIFAVYSASFVQQRIKFVKSLESRDQLRMMAESGIYRMISEILLEAQSDSDLLFSKFMDVSSVLDAPGLNLKADDTSSNISYNYNLSFPQGRVFCYIDDIEAKLNLNTAKKESIKSLLLKLCALDEEESEELASSIIDWSDADNERPELQVINNEDLHYRLDKFTYSPKNSGFTSLEELLLVKEMTPGIFKALEPYVTVFGNGKVNINTCSLPVLESLVVSPGLLGKILAFRESPSLKKSGENLFQSISSLEGDLDKFAALNDDEKKSLKDLIASDAIGVDSDCFNLLSVAKINSSKQRCYTSCVFDKNNKILYWREQFRAE